MRAKINVQTGPAGTARSKKMRISEFHNFKSPVSACNRIYDTKCIINTNETYLGCVLNAWKK